MRVLHVVADGSIDVHSLLRVIPGGALVATTSLQAVVG